jgi:hypothetical protein
MATPIGSAMLRGRLMLAFLGVILLAVGRTVACLCGHGIARVRSGTKSH